MRTLILASLASVTLTSVSHAATYELKVTPQTVAWGHYDATDKPVLTIKSGDTVVMHTLLTNNPAGLERPASRPPTSNPNCAPSMMPCRNRRAVPAGIS